MSFEESSPAAGAAEYLRDPSIRLLVEFFRAKGLAALKEEDREEAWYQDWIDYQAGHGLYAGLLSPARYSSRGARFDLRRLTRFLEAFAYFSPAHAYSLHVSFLGLFPILLSSNEPLKQEAVAKLEAGGLFAFAVSERDHGADLFANEFAVTPAGPGGQVAGGSKYYIGNANVAAVVSVLARQAGGGAGRRSPFVFFALRPAEAPAYRNVRKIRTLGIRPAFVGGFEVEGHPLPEADVISRGREAWEAVFSTVDLGKYFLGFGALGICEHSFAEALGHTRRRILYGKPVAEMPHIRATTAAAFARLSAMKLYAYRALDYLQAADAGERRYLLFNAVQKAKVSTEGVKVMGLLSECVGARGVEAETYVESALRDAQLIPGLEGSTHINFGLAAQFLGPYFAGRDGNARAPESVTLRRDAAGENPYWMAAHDRNPKTVRFARPGAAYRPLRGVANVRAFRRQVRAFGAFAGGPVPAPGQPEDSARLIAVGKCLATIAYGQLVAEGCRAARVAAATVSVIFHGLVEDLSAEALKLAAMLPAGGASRVLLRRVVRVPESIAADLDPLGEFIAARYGA